MVSINQLKLLKVIVINKSAKLQKIDIDKSAKIKNIIGIKKPATITKNNLVSINQLKLQK